MHSVSERQMAVRPQRRVTGLQSSVVALALLVAAWSASTQSRAQALDCERLQQQIAQLDRGGGSRFAQAARRQASELARTQAYAHQLGCDGFTFFGGNPQCSGLNARIGQMQANLAQLQAAGTGGARGGLVARFNAYCRGGQAPDQPRGFFESIFGGAPTQRPPALPQLPADGDRATDDDDGSIRAHGGSQAVCVRSCDGGFFPLGISARHSTDDLTQMCQALCPGTDVAVYTRNPDSEIKSAVGLDGKPYMNLPNALHFQKTFTPACSCRMAGKSWADTLANAEAVLDNTRKGDIVVTPEKSAELSRPKVDATTRGGQSAVTSPVSPALPEAAASLPSHADGAKNGSVNDGAKRTVRQVGPQL